MSGLYDRDETKFFLEIGVPRETIEKKCKNGSVLDMQACYAKIKEMHNEQFGITKPNFQEDPSEAKTRKTKQRINAFGMRYLDSLINEAFLADYDANKIRHRVKLGAEILRNLQNWSPDKPFFSETNKPRAYYLAGTSGLGKSTFMQAHAVRLYDQASDQDKLKGNLVRFISLSEFFTKYYSTKEDHVKNELEQSFSYTKFLFIDDIGAEKFSEGKEDVLKNLLQKRMEGSSDHKTKWTFFNSNYSVESLPYSDPIKRRITDLAKQIIVGGLLEKRERFDSNTNFSFS
jgi:DNA replication protein DnaC